LITRKKRSPLPASIPNLRVSGLVICCKEDHQRKDEDYQGLQDQTSYPHFSEHILHITILLSSQLTAFQGEQIPPSENGSDPVFSVESREI